MNSTKSVSRSTSESSAMMGDVYEHMALARIVETVRLTGQVRAFFDNYADTVENTDALQQNVFLDTFKTVLDSGMYQQLSAQSVFQRIAETLIALDDGEIDCTIPTEWRMYRNIAKRFVQAFIADGWMEYQPAERYTKNGEAAEIPAFYVLNSKMLKRSIQHLLHDAPCVSMRFINSKHSKHYAGALAMSSHKFRVNVQRAAECKGFLDKGYFLNKKDVWQAVDPSNKKEVAKHEQQKQALAQARVAYSTKPNGWHYEVKSDFRGRLYYVSGMLNPQAGGVALYILTDDDMITYDSTASFAQFISVVTGDRNLADACNLLNYSHKVKDFYGNVYALASGRPCPSKDSFEREVAKQYLMPKAYGSSDEASRERAVRMAVEAGQDEQQATAIVDILTTYDGLNRVKNAAANAAEALAEEGQQLSWVTPSGFTVTQNYWMTESEEWNTGESNNEYCPTRITFKERTDVVKVMRDDKDNRSAIVAAAANFIQSLDAAFMANVQAAYYARTGETIIGIHDSFTLTNALLVDTFKDIAWEEFCKLAMSDELQAMRDVIGLPQKDLMWLNPKRIPLFIDKE